MENIKHVKALGEGNVTKLIIRYSLPTMFATVMNAAYNVVDRIFVGRACGEDAIASITVCFAPSMILLAVGMTVGVGSATIASIQLGEKNYANAEKILGQAIFLFLVFYAFVALAMLSFMPQILTFMGATERILPDACAYYSIIIGGLIFEKISFGVNNMIRAEGRPVYAMTTLLIGASVNVILDYIFLFKFNMGVRGAAIATVIAQACASLWVLAFYASKLSFIKIRLKNLRVHLPMLKSMLAAGSPSFVIQFLTGVAAMAFVQQARKYGSESAISIIGINTTVLAFMFLPIVGISMGIQPIIGYNWGMKNYLRVREALVSAIFAGTAISTAGFLLCQFGAKYIFMLFLGSDSQLIGDGIYALRIVSAAFAFIALNIVASGYFQSTKRPQLSIAITMLRQVIFLIPFLLILPEYIGITGVWISYPISDFMAFLFTLAIVFRELKRLIAKQEKQKEFFEHMREKYYDNT